MKLYKFAHTSDLHLGKKLDGIDLLEDQRHILKSIIKIIKEEEVNGIIIAGDIYDRSQPSVEAVKLLDDFITDLSQMGISVFAISGNHDSPQRLSWCSNIIKNSGVFISPVYHGDLMRVTVNDEIGDIDITFMPYLSPASVNAAIKGDNEDIRIRSHNEAVSYALENMKITNMLNRQILIAHQFVTGAERSESEDIYVGGMDNVEASQMEDFDYVALGHIHKKQNIKGKNILRYSGTPLKYSISEKNDEKSVTIFSLPERGKVNMYEVPLSPLHNIVEIRGDLKDIIKPDFYSDYNREDYFSIVLTDTILKPDARNILSNIYENILSIRYDRLFTIGEDNIEASKCIDDRTPMEYMSDFYKAQMEMDLTDEQEQYLTDIIFRLKERD